ncbi:ankyrin repeat domain-containing protein [Wolbachia endosymbiont (group A) of Pogonocherus hispidulus]|uniref:ankyrin repeat domain-containing protein n=1 Tax=Wolbachia endosymbiont (group A) of Pogonocherus hispidulus TaxID=3066136 RepID=UPI003342A0E0
MAYSNDDIRELCLDIDMILVNGDKYNDRVTSLEDLQNRLRRKAEFKEIDFQSKCEVDNSLGDLLLKHATENDNSRVKDFLLQNGCEPLQEQIAAAINEEEEAPDVEANKSDSNEVDSSNFINPGMTAEVLYKQLTQGRETNRAIFDSFANAVRESNITGDRGVFLDVVKLFTDLDAVIHLTDTASRTILGIAAITKQADVVKVLLGSSKFNEEEKFNALRSAIVQGNVQEVEAFLGYVNDESRQAALELAMDNAQEEITQVLLNFITPETPNVEENRAKPCSSNGNIGSRTVATVPPVSTNGDNHNNENKTPVSTRTDQTATPNNGNKANGFVDAQFSVPNEKEAKYKESKENFYTSLTKDAVGVVITGLFIAAAVMVPFAVGAAICGIVAALVAVCTGLHIKNSTLPSYREMEENKIEHVSSKTAQTL